LGEAASAVDSCPGCASVRRAVYHRRGKLGATAGLTATPLFSLQITISKANANDYVPVNSMAKQQFKRLLPKERIA